MKRILLLSLCFLMGLTALNAQNSIDFDGEITSDVVWNSSIDTVRIIGDVFIDTIGTLKIEAGVVIEFQSAYKIDVEGSIVTAGSESDPIIFTVADTTGYYDYSHDGWLGIDFLNTDVDADSSIFEFAEFYYGFAPSGSNEEENGGAIFVQNINNLRISNCIFKFNYADSYGGAIHTKNTVLKIENCLFEENFADGYGGAVNIAGGDEDATKVEMLNNTFLNNYCTDRGGALRLVAEKDSYIANNTFKFNTAEYMGGAIFVGGDEDSTIFINNYISNNVSGTESNSGSGGGGIRTSGYCTPIFINNIIVNNTSYDRGGGFLSGYDSAPIIINSVIANNKSESSGGGLFVSCSYVYDIYVHNTIISNNEDVCDDAEQVYIDAVGDPTVHFHNCNIEGDTTDMYVNGDKSDLVYLNNINETPNFVNATSEVGADFDTNPEDWKLLETSPCLEAGDVSDLSYWMPENDYFGNTRVIAGTIDIGAHEYELIREFEINAETTVITTNGGTLQFTATITPNDATNVTVEWSVAEGTGSATIDETGLLTAVSNGTVTIKGTTKDGTNLSDELEITISNQITGIDDIREEMVKVYPNPANELINLELSQNSNYEVEIIDVTGKVLIYKELTENIEQINISELNSGLYFVKVSNRSESNVTRLIKR